jgi:hypothetical protein
MLLALLLGSIILFCTLYCVVELSIIAISLPNDMTDLDQNSLQVV